VPKKPLPKSRWRDPDTGDLAIKVGTHVIWTRPGSTVSMVGVVTEIMGEHVYVNLDDSGVTVVTYLEKLEVSDG
jgi:hypothetical protein